MQDQGWVFGVSFCSPFPETLSFPRNPFLPPEKRPNQAFQQTPLNTYVGEQAFTGLDHRRDSDMFATSGRCVELWDYNRNEPVFAMEWGSESVASVAWNRVETNILAATASDCSVILYDVNTNTPLHKLFLKMRSNAISWNPMEAYNFVIANDDGTKIQPTYNQIPPELNQSPRTQPIQPRINQTSPFLILCRVPACLLCLFAWLSPNFCGCR